MLQSRNHLSRETKSLKKKRNKTEPLNNVISLRINDNEMKSLQKLTKSTSKSISEIMREAIDQWSATRDTLCMD